MTLTALAYIGLDIVALSVLVGALYIPRHGRRDLVAAYIGVNVGVLAVTILLSSATVAEGLGLGLFGVLSIIRLRSTALAQGEVAYFFAALALGLLGGIEAPIGAVAILMGLVLAALFVGDHPALMRRNRNQVVTLDRAISDENELTDRLGELLNAKVLNLDIQRIDLVNDTTVIDVRYRLHRSQPQAVEAPQQPQSTHLAAPASSSSPEILAPAPPGEARPTPPQGVGTATLPPPSGQPGQADQRNRPTQQGQGYRSSATTQPIRPTAQPQTSWTESAWPEYPGSSGSSGAPPPSYPASR